jgi:hypothetical protein
LGYIDPDWHSVHKLPQRQFISGDGEELVVFDLSEIEDRLGLMQDPSRQGLVQRFGESALAGVNHAVRLKDDRNPEMGEDGGGGKRHKISSKVHLRQIEGVAMPYQPSEQARACETGKTGEGNNAPSWASVDGYAFDLGRYR